MSEIQINMIKKRLINTSLFSLILVGLINCQTYYIPIESFRDQFKGVDSTKLRMVRTVGTIGAGDEYLANPIDSIKCFDKENNSFLLKNSPSVEIRFTEKNNKRTVFYFDRVYLKDTLIIGSMSRIIPYYKTISINNVKLIEIQDGHKNIQYAEKKKKLK
jgi:hypothetical protein